MEGTVQSPEKELRFTRSGQALAFWVLSAMLAAAGITLLLTAIYRDVNPELLHPLWALVPFGLSAGMLRVAVLLTRHAYLILSPLGVEIFPFINPVKKMRLVLWQELDHAIIDEKSQRLTLHFDAAETSGIHLSLRPIRGDRRCLLAKAMIERLTPP